MAWHTVKWGNFAMFLLLDVFASHSHMKSLVDWAWIRPMTIALYFMGFVLIDILKTDWVAGRSQLVRLRQPERDIFPYLGHARAHDNDDNRISTPITPII